MARGTSFSLGPLDSAQRSEGADESEAAPQAENVAAENESDLAVDLPFGVTIGTAEAYSGGYVVTAVDARQGGSHAVMAILDSAVSRGRVLDLGRVYGDAEPPQVVVLDDRAFVLVPDTDASGSSLRYGWIRGLESANRVEWIGSFEQTVDDSPVFSLATVAGGIAIAWDEVERKSHQSFVRWATLDAQGNRVPAAAAPSAKKRKTAADVAVSSTSPDVDAEAPQLVAHRTGYWLAYLAGDPSKAKTPRLGTGTVAKRGNAAEVNDDLRVVELGRRGIEVVPLDAAGRVNGKPIVVAERSAHVVTFDIEGTPDAGAIVAYRDADTTPGVEAQVIEIARIRPDGGVERLHLDDERVGAGMPILLVDEETGSPKPDDVAWLAVAGSAGETRLAELRSPGTPLLGLVEAPRLVGVEPMLRRGDSLLVARHRARLVEFERLDCTWKAAASGPPPLPGN